MMLYSEFLQCSAPSCLARLVPGDHLFRNPAISYCFIFIHGKLSAALSQKVLDCADISGGDFGCIGAKCVSYEQKKLWPGWRWFCPDHSKGPEERRVVKNLAFDIHVVSNLL